MLHELSPTQYRYTPDAGSHPPDMVIHCGVCGDETEVELNCFGPRGYAQAMSYHNAKEEDKKNHASNYDEYQCPNREEMWHRQIISLRNEAKKTPSKKMETELLLEAKSILATRKHTKKLGCLEGW